MILRHSGWLFTVCLTALLPVGSANAQEAPPGDEQTQDAPADYFDLRRSNDRTARLTAERYFTLVKLQEWSDATGKSKVMAKYVEHDPDLQWVKIEAVRGRGAERVVKEITVPVEKLSKLCQSRVRQIAALQKKLDELLAKAGTADDAAAGGRPFEDPGAPMLDERGAEPGAAGTIGERDSDPDLRLPSGPGQEESPAEFEEDPMGFAELAASLPAPGAGPGELSNQNFPLPGFPGPAPAGALAPGPSAAGATSDVSTLLQPILSRNGVPALAAVVVGSDGVRAIGAVGVRRIGGPETVTADDLFHIGSNTKAMTATLCAILVEEGKLRWDSTLAEVFPQLKGQMDAGWHGVTLEQLLRHEGGAPADLDAGGLWEKLWKHQGSPTSARRLLLTGVTARPPANPIGENAYSNAGYAIAGHMAETVTGQAWEELMREKLFRPLEINSAGFGAPGTSGQADQPRGHQPNGTPVEPGLGADNPVAIGPAGIVHCTLGDYAKFLRLHLNGANGRAELLSADSFKKLHTAPNGRQFAMGWIVAKVNNSTIFAHSGSNTMWFCTAWIIPDQDIAVAVACNQAGPGEKACDEAIAALWQQYARR